MLTRYQQYTNHTSTIYTQTYGWANNNFEGPPSGSLTDPGFQCTCDRWQHNPWRLLGQVLHDILWSGTEFRNVQQTGRHLGSFFRLLGGWLWRVSGLFRCFNWVYDSLWRILTTNRDWSMLVEALKRNHHLRVSTAQLCPTAASLCDLLPIADLPDQTCLLVKHI